MLSEGTIRRIYYQGEDAIIRLVKKLEVRTEDLEAMHTSAPERRIASLSKELSRTRDQLSRQSEEHLQERQQNHLLVQLIREPEREIERGGSGTSSASAIERDTHNSSQPSSLDPPWKKVKRTRSLRARSGKKVGGQPGHKGITLMQVAEPDQVIVHRPEVCAGCGTALGDSDGVPGSVRRQIFDISDG